MYTILNMRLMLQVTESTCDSQGLTGSLHDPAYVDLGQQLMAEEHVRYPAEDGARDPSGSSHRCAHPPRGLQTHSNLQYPRYYQYPSLKKLL